MTLMTWIATVAGWWYFCDDYDDDTQKEEAESVGVRIESLSLASHQCKQPQQLFYHYAPYCTGICHEDGNDWDDGIKVPEEDKKLLKECGQLITSGWLMWMTFVKMTRDIIYFNFYVLSVGGSCSQNKKLNMRRNIKADCSCYHFEFLPILIAKMGTRFGNSSSCCQTIKYSHFDPIQCHLSCCCNKYDWLENDFWEWATAKMASTLSQMSPFSFLQSVQKWNSWPLNLNYSKMGKNWKCSHFLLPLLL